MKYVPFLKTKQGEMNALRNLTANQASNITPLFDVHRNLNPDKELQKHLDSVCNQIIRTWDARWFMVDLFDLDPSLRTDAGEHPAHYVFNRLAAAELQFIPCSGLDRDNDYKEQVRGVISETNSVAIRLQREDIQAPFLSVPDISRQIEYLEIDPSRVTILLDFREVIANPSLLASSCP